MNVLAKNRAPEKGKFSPFVIYFVSFVFTVSVCFVLSIFMKNLIMKYSTDTQTLLITFMSIIGVLFFSIIVLVGLILNRMTIERTYVKELKNFKDFTDSLHRVSSEKEVYEIMYNFICKIAMVNNITLFYRSEKVYGDNSDSTWQRMGYEKVPLCSMSPQSCPVIKTGRECRITSIQNGVTCACQLPEYKAGSYVCLIIVDIGYPQSILQLYSKNDNAFDGAIISKIKSYTEIVKMVINSRRTLSSLDKKASTDKLTKVYNRNYLDTFLDNQIELTSHSNDYLSLIMLDIDHFKSVNDTYGHAAGDHILALFAQLIVKCTRVTDLVARFGGEEFIVVLPSTTIDTAQGIAERIRQTVEQAYMPPYGGVDLPSISCSLGVSSFPLFCDNKDDLIKTADTALYKAKQSGRNCTVVYDRTMTSIEKS
jgi:diguanylate cyclase (GGDEF)-like protein